MKKERTLKLAEREDEAALRIGFKATRCLFCNEEDDRIVYAPSLREDSFTSYTFSARRKRKREHYRIVSCKKCGLVRSNPIIEENMMNNLYAESEFIFSNEAPFTAMTYLKLLERLMNRYGSNGKSLLELGCSTGFFLEAARQMGVEELVGFEPSRNCYRQAVHSMKENIINDVYRSELLRDKKFDIVCSFHVFDHLLNPLDTLSSLLERINDDGHVLVVCHDVEGSSVKCLGRWSPIFDIEHVYLFSRKTLNMLFERAGLTVLEVGGLSNTYPISYWLRMMPVLNNIVDMIPGTIGNMPLSLKAGNLYIYAKKKGTKC